MQQQRRDARARLASAAASLKRRPGDPDAVRAVDDLRTEYRTVALEEHIRAVVAEAPPLTPVQRDRLALLLRPVEAGGPDAA